MTHRGTKTAGILLPREVSTAGRGSSPQRTTPERILAHRRDQLGDLAGVCPKSDDPAVKHVDAK